MITTAKSVRLAHNTFTVGETEDSMNKVVHMYRTLKKHTTITHSSFYTQAIRETTILIREISTVLIFTIHYLESQSLFRSIIEE